MKALVAPSYGPLDQLVVTDVPTPSPGPGELLLRVRAAALNPLDIKLTTGEMRELMPLRHPHVLGVEVAATVSAVGSGVTRFAAGDEVLALTFPGGGIAEYAVVTDGPTVVHRPAALDVALAATLPSAATTAAALVSGLLADRSVLIVGSTGGVGSFAVQLAVAAGARVLATAGPDDTSYVRALGARHILDHTTGDPVADALRLVPGGVDLAVDLVNAGPGLAATAAAVRTGGRLVSPLGGPAAFDRGVTAEYLGAEDGFAHLPALVERAATGGLTVEISTRPFADAPSAVADLAAKHTRGKTVVLL